MPDSPDTETQNQAYYTSLIDRANSLLDQEIPSDTNSREERALELMAGHFAHELSGSRQPDGTRTPEHARVWRAMSLMCQDVSQNPIISSVFHTLEGEGGLEGKLDRPVQDVDVKVNLLQPTETTDPDLAEAANEVIRMGVEYLTQKHSAIATPEEGSIRVTKQVTSPVA